MNSSPNTLTFSAEGVATTLFSPINPANPLPPPPPAAWMLTVPGTVPLAIVTVKFSETNVANEGASSTPPSGSRSYGVYYKFSVNQTDLLEHYMGAEKIVTPYFSDTSAFYVGDGVGTPAKYTAQAAGLYYAFYSFYKSSSFNRYFTVHKTFSDFWDAKPTTPTHSSSTFLEQFYVMDVGDELTFSYRIDYVWLTGDIEVNYWVYYLGPLT